MTTLSSLYVQEAIIIFRNQIVFTLTMFIAI